MNIILAASDPTVISLLVGALSAMATVVGYLWRLVQKTMEEIKVKLNDCEEDREDLWKALIAANPSIEIPKKSK